MSDLGQTVDRLVTRDMAYIVAGGSVLLSLGYAVGHMPPHEVPVLWALFGAGVSYVVGFVVQELMSLLGVVNTSLNVGKPSSALRWLYRRWNHVEWIQPDSDAAVLNRYMHLCAHGSPASLQALDRVMMLQQFGNTMGSAWLVSGSIVMIGALCCHSGCNLVLAISLLAVAAVLVVLGRLQGMWFAALTLQFDVHSHRHA